MQQADILEIYIHFIKRSENNRYTHVLDNSNSICNFTHFEYI